MGDDVPSLEQLAEMGATETEQPEQQSEQQPSTAEQQQGKSEDAVAEHVMEDLVDSVSSYVSKKTGLPQQAVKQLLTDLIRTDEDFASEFASTVSRVKSTLQDLAVGNTSKRVLDYTMARAISKLGNKMIARIEDDYYADDYADIKTCYFLLNYAGVRVHGRVAMKYDTCYFLLNYAYIFGCGVVVW